MKESTKNLIEKRIKKEDCPERIKNFLLKLIMEESLHSHIKHWLYKKTYKSLIQKYYNREDQNED